jgi:hypothetical protein
MGFEPEEQINTNGFADGFDLLIIAFDLTGGHDASCPYTPMRSFLLINRIYVPYINYMTGVKKIISKMIYYVN